MIDPLRSAVSSEAKLAMFRVRDDVFNGGCPLIEEVLDLTFRYVDSSLHLSLGTLSNLMKPE